MEFEPHMQSVQNSKNFDSCFTVMQGETSVSTCMGGDNSTNKENRYGI